MRQAEPCSAHDVPHGAETATVTTPEATGTTTTTDRAHRAEIATAAGAGPTGGSLRRPGGEFHESPA